MRCTYESYGTDIGNGFLKINDGHTPAWSTPSWYAEVPPGSQFPNLDLYSLHVRYLDGVRPDLKGKEWLIGPAAKYTDAPVPACGKPPLYSSGEILVAKEVNPAKTPENNWLQARYNAPYAEYSCAPDSAGWIAYRAPH